MPEILISPRTPSVQGLECPICSQRAHQHLMTYPAHSSLFKNRTVARCLGCGLAYLYPMVPTEVLNDYYHNGAFWGHVSDTTPFDIPTYHHQAKARVDFINDRMPLHGKIDVLDIGAGYGVMESYLKKAVDTEIGCFAVEPDQKAQDALEKIGVRWSPSIDSFQNKKFDLLILSHVLEHINQPIPYLKKLVDLCHSSSLLFIEVPNEDFQFKFDLEPHVLFLSPRSLSRILELSGYDVIAMEMCGLKRDEQRRMNLAAKARAEWISRLPFLNALKKIRNATRGEPAPHLLDPFSVPDKFDCSIYGEDRIWIRCLARPSNRGGS